MPTSQEEIDAFVDDLKWGHPERRKKAAIKLGRIRDQRVIPHLITAMQSDEYSWTRISAIQSLTWIADPSVIEPMMDVAMKDGSPSVRKTAIESLGSLKDKKALIILNQIFNSEVDYEIKTAASVAIKALQSS